MSSAASAKGLDALRPYLPAELQSRLESSRTHRGVEGERRVVTILFCDVKGSTAAASKLDPEEWTEIINGAFEYMIKPVYTYDGTVARLTGDGILAFFGAPIAHEDDPQRAVLAGLAIVDGVRSYGETIRARWGIDFSVRVGINTGLVVVGAIGSTQRMEYTAMGDAINIAARMEQTADVNTVRISGETYEQVTPQFEVQELGEIAVHGKDAPVAAYRAAAEDGVAAQAPHVAHRNTPDWA
ncbi:MAG: adenylate/guanylate cyclase domain-containing protein [Caldilineales bacterium]